MTFRQAERKLKRMVGKNRYHTVQFERIHFHDGEVVDKCQLYVDPKILIESNTWELAFERLKVALRR